MRSISPRYVGRLEAGLRGAGFQPVVPLASSRHALAKTSLCATAPGWRRGTPPRRPAEKPALRPPGKAARASARFQPASASSQPRLPCSRHRMRCILGWIPTHPCELALLVCADASDPISDRTLAVNGCTHCLARMQPSRNRIQPSEFGCKPIRNGIQHSRERLPDSRDRQLRCRNTGFGCFDGWVASENG